MHIFQKRFHGLALNLRDAGVLEVLEHLFANGLAEGGQPLGFLCQVIFEADSLRGAQTPHGAEHPEPRLRNQNSGAVDSTRAETRRADHDLGGGGH